MRPRLLWCRRAVAELIETQAGVRLSLSAVGLYLARWDLTAPTTPQWFPDGPEAGFRTVWLAWTRAVPRHLDEELLPGPGSFAAGPIPRRVGKAPGHLELLTAQSARRDLHFLATQRLWDPPALTDFGARLVETLGHPVRLVVRAWPSEQTAVLHPGPRTPARTCASATSDARAGPTAEPRGPTPRTDARRIGAPGANPDG